MVFSPSKSFIPYCLNSKVLFFTLLFYFYKVAFNTPWLPFCSYIPLPFFTTLCQAIRWLLQIIFDLELVPGRHVPLPPVGSPPAMTNIISWTFLGRYCSNGNLIITLWIKHWLCLLWRRLTPLKRTSDPLV